MGKFAPFTPFTSPSKQAPDCIVAITPPYNSQSSKDPTQACLQTAFIITSKYVHAGTVYRKGE
jgi:hypothetical protein